MKAIWGDLGIHRSSFHLMGLSQTPTHAIKIAAGFQAMFRIWNFPAQRLVSRVEISRAAWGLTQENKKGHCVSQIDHLQRLGWKAFPLLLPHHCFSPRPSAYFWSEEGKRNGNRPFQCWPAIKFPASFVGMTAGCLPSESDTSNISFLPETPRAMSMILLHPAYVCIHGHVAWSGLLFSRNPQNQISSMSSETNNRRHSIYFCPRHNILYIIFGYRAKRTVAELQEDKHYLRLLFHLSSKPTHTGHAIVTFLTTTLQLSNKVVLFSCHSSTVFVCGIKRGGAYVQLGYVKGIAFLMGKKQFQIVNPAETICRPKILIQRWGRFSGLFWVLQTSATYPLLRIHQEDKRGCT